MEISAKVLADTISEDGIRLTTMEVSYHRYILPEVNTHRAFSRNGASSRAIPTSRLLETVMKELVEPIEWGKNTSGMQAHELLDPETTAKAKAIWNEAREAAVDAARRMSELGAAKQIVNRVLEPFLPTKTVLSSTDWANHDALRYHPDAQPEIRELARKMIEARSASSPKFLAFGEWHLPYITAEDFDSIHRNGFDIETYQRIHSCLVSNATSYFHYSGKNIVLAAASAARCARASYRLHDGAATTIEKDVELFERLIKSQPVHASPVEHQATPLPGGLGERTPLTGNYRGFVQFRKLIKNETVLDI